MSDPSSPLSIVITVSITVVRNNPGRQVAAPDTDELIRIAEARKHPEVVSEPREAPRIAAR